MNKRRSLKLELNAAGKSLGEIRVQEIAEMYSHLPAEQRVMRRVETYLKLGKSLDKQLHSASYSQCQLRRRWNSLGEKRGYTSDIAEQAYRKYVYAADVMLLLQALKRYYNEVPA